MPTSSHIVLPAKFRYRHQVRDEKSSGKKVWFTQNTLIVRKFGSGQESMEVPVRRRYRRSCTSYPSMVLVNWQDNPR